MCPAVDDAADSDYPSSRHWIAAAVGGRLALAPRRHHGKYALVAQFVA